MDNSNNNDSNKITCSICLSDAVDPIVTQCGHIFCWNCIKLWLRDKTEHKCSVCRNGVDLNNVIPLFGGKITNQSDRPKSKIIDPVVNNNRPGFVI